MWKFVKQAKTVEPWTMHAKKAERPAATNIVDRFVRRPRRRGGREWRAT